MANQHGEFVWYELMTQDREAALAFYGSILGWDAVDSGHEQYGYSIVSKRDEFSDESHPVAGVLQLTDDMRDAGARPVWLGYIAVDDVDQSVQGVVSAGGALKMSGTDVPDVGRIAMVADPQGAHFYIMQCKEADKEQASSLAFASDRPRVGHCAWNELVTEDPDAAKAFYFSRFGWTKEDEMDLGEMGRYEFIHHNGVIGAVMRKPQELPVSMWHYYFRCPDIDRAGNMIAGLGGTVLYGPHEIPGGDYVIKGFDPQGALFALVGGRKK